MVYRKGELSKSTIDREWPYQVALRTEITTGAHYTAIHDFCRIENLSLCPRRHEFQRDDVWYVCFCFGNREDAECFYQRFGGEHINPAARPKWPPSARRINAIAEAGHRNGRCGNCDD